MAREWRFVLRSELRGEVELVHEPRDWSSRETKLVRDMKLYGVSLEISSPFTFVKEGYAYLKDVFNRQGYNAQAWVDVFQYDQALRRYVSYFSGEFIMRTIDVGDADLSIQATSDTASKLLKDRSNVEVQLDTAFTYDYGWIQFSLPYVFAGMHGFIVDRKVSGTWVTMKTLGMASGELLQIGFDELAVDQMPGWIKERATIDSSEVFPILKAEFDGEYTFDVGFIVGVNSTVGDELQFYYRINKYGTPVAVSTELTIGLYYMITEDATIELKRGDTLYFYATCGRNHTAKIGVGLDGMGRPIGSPETDKFIITAKTTLMTTFPNGAMAFEMVQQCLTIMLGGENILTSNALGRTDLGYAVDAPAGMNLICTGAGLATKGTSIKTSFKKVFSDGLAPIYNLGIDTFKTTDGITRVVIEEMAFFFKNTVGFTINGVTNVRKRVATELIHEEVLVGYTKYESKLPGSEQDPHTESSFLVPGRFVKNPLDIRSGLIASSWKIDEKRADFINSTTKDTNDGDLYVVNVQRDVGSYDSLSNEEFDTVEGVDNGESLYNLNITPARNLRRWGSYISACYYRNPDQVRWNSSESESDLVTLKTGEEVPVSERQSIPSDLLPAPLWLPEVYEFEMKLKAEDDRILISKKYEIVRVIDNEGATYYGYILERTRTEKNEATFTLLRANYNG